MRKCDIIGRNIRPGMVPGGFSNQRETGTKRKSPYRDSVETNQAATKLLDDRRYDELSTRSDLPAPPCQPPAPQPTVPDASSSPPTSSGPQVDESAPPATETGT